MEMRDGGVSCTQMKEAGFSSLQAKEAGFGPEEAFRAGYSKGWRSALEMDGVSGADERMNLMLRSIVRDCARGSACESRLWGRDRVCVRD